MATQVSALTTTGISKVVARYQVTVPPEIRKIYGLEEGDLMEWSFNPETSELTVRPKRPQLLTPQVRREMAEMRVQGKSDDWVSSKELTSRD